MQSMDLSSLGSRKKTEPNRVSDLQETRLGKGTDHFPLTANECHVGWRLILDQGLSTGKIEMVDLEEDEIHREHINAILGKHMSSASMLVRCKAFRVVTSGTGSEQGQQPGATEDSSPSRSQNA